jgi:hypothetical protein
MTVTGTITPWLLGALTVLFLIAVAITAKSWREAKCSPYFFLRRQAMQRMQSYSLLSIALLFITLITAAYTWQKPADPVLRTALIAYAKPNIDSLSQNQAPLASLVDLEMASSVIFVRFPEAGLLDGLGIDVESTTPLAQDTRTVPENFNRVQPTTPLREDTQLGSVAFSMQIDNKYEALNPNNQFGEGFFKLYATFRYDAMENGMSWAWVWRHNGTVVDGDNQLWTYGSDGPGFIYFQPEDGFKPGEYTLQVWVNSQLLTQAAVIIAEGISAGN